MTPQESYSFSENEGQIGPRFSKFRNWESENLKSTLLHIVKLQRSGQFVVLRNTRAICNNV